MNRIELEAVVHARRQQEGRNFEKDHSLAECVERLAPAPRTEERPRRKKKDEVKEAH